VLPCAFHGEKKHHPQPAQRNTKEENNPMKKGLQKANNIYFESKHHLKDQFALEE
jgi:hypothetical protein